MQGWLSKHFKSAILGYWIPSWSRVKRRTSLFLSNWTSPKASACSTELPSMSSAFPSSIRHVINKPTHWPSSRLNTEGWLEDLPLWSGGIKPIEISKTRPSWWQSLSKKGLNTSTMEKVPSILILLWVLLSVVYSIKETFKFSRREESYFARQTSLIPSTGRDFLARAKKVRDFWQGLRKAAFAELSTMRSSKFAPEYPKNHDSSIS